MPYAPRPASTRSGTSTAWWDGKAWGWAFFPSAPTQRVPLRLVVDGVDVAEGVADGYRGALHEKGCGDGCCAFVFVLPADELDGREHGVEVVSAGTGRPLLAQMQTYRLDALGVKRRRVVDLLFDAALYEKAVGPVVDALDHYRRIGWRRGFNPHPLFDVRRYSRLQGLGPNVEPLAHFEAVGQYEGASIHALFDRPAITGADGRRGHPIFTYLEQTSPRYLEPSPFRSIIDLRERVFCPAHLPAVGQSRKPLDTSRPHLRIGLQPVDHRATPMMSAISLSVSRSSARMTARIASSERSG